MHPNLDEYTSVIHSDYPCWGDLGMMAFYIIYFSKIFIFILTTNFLIWKKFILKIKSSKVETFRMTMMLKAN